MLSPDRTTARIGVRAGVGAIWALLALGVKPRSPPVTVVGRRLGPVYERPATDPEPFVYPVAQYDHDEGFAIGGGHVHRGVSIPALVGKYVFTEFVRGRVLAFDADDVVPGHPAPIEEVRLAFDEVERELVDVSGYPIDTRRVDARLSVDATASCISLPRAMVASAGSCRTRRTHATTSTSREPGISTTTVRPTCCCATSMGGHDLVAQHQSPRLEAFDVSTVDACSWRALTSGRTAPISSTTSSAGCVSTRRRRLRLPAAFASVSGSIRPASVP